MIIFYKNWFLRKKEQWILKNVHAIQLRKWNEFSCRQQSFSFTETGNLIKKLSGNINPYDVFTLFVDDEIIDLLVLLETNRYAEQKLNKSELAPSSRMHKWTRTNCEFIV